MTEISVASVSEVWRSPSLEELRSAQAVMRDDLLDINALASLLETTVSAAALAVRTLQGSILLKRCALRALLARLKRVPIQRVSMSDIDLAFAVYDLFREAGTPMHPAPDSTLDELAGVGAAMCNERAADHVLVGFLSDSPFAVREMLSVACHSSVLDDLLTVCLLLRLYGLRVALREISSALHALVGHQVAELHRALAH